MSENKKILITKTQSKIIAIIMTGILAVMFFTSQGNNTQEEVKKEPEVNYEAQLENLKLEKEKTETLIEATEFKKQAEQLEKQAEELENSLTESDPKANDLATVILETADKVEYTDDLNELPKDNKWAKFTEFAKANPFQGQVFESGKNHLQIAKERMDWYEGIEGCHPYILVSIHYTETGLQLNNGANGQGAFQHYSSPVRYKPNSTITKEQLREQANKTCQYLRNKVNSADLSSLSDPNIIGKALALYNGCYSPTIGAYARSDYGQWNGWDKCPYTANKLTTNDKMLQCAIDGCSKWNTRQIYGTMAFIAQLLI